MAKSRVGELHPLRGFRARGSRRCLAQFPQASSSPKGRARQDRRQARWVYRVLDSGIVPAHRCLAQFLSWSGSPAESISAGEFARTGEQGSIDNQAVFLDVLAGEMLTQRRVQPQVEETILFLPVEALRGHPGQGGQDAVLAPPAMLGELPPQLRQAPGPEG